MNSGDASRLDAETQFVRREIILLAVLAVVAVGAFQFTRMVADREQRATTRDAAAWYDVGVRQLQAGQAGDAVDSLRHATRRDRGNRTYGAALARALVAAGRGDDARLVLIDLRESAPDDPQISEELARLASSREDVEEAARYYRNALYGVWDPAHNDARIRLQIEFIRFLLAHRQSTTALAELLAVVPNLPDDTAAHVEAGQLLLSAGDNARARDQFSRALAREPRNLEALTGAAEAAFAGGDYVATRRYLSGVSNPSARAAYLRDVSELVLTSDPLAPRLTLAERELRLTAAIAQVLRRLDNCRSTAQPQSVEASARLETLRGEAAAFDASVMPAALRASPDLVETGVELVDRVETESAGLCGAPTGLDEALLINARRRGAQAQ
jgi:Tfp pilus assembly protein PilF